MGNDIEKRKKVTLPVEWASNEASVEAIKAMSGALNLTGNHGIITSIPIICKAEKCPYSATCAMKALNIDINTLKGQRCPVEVTKIMRKFELYAEEFNIDVNNADQVVLGLIKELIDYDIQIERADQIMASDGHFLTDVVVGIDVNGRTVTNKDISKPVEYKQIATKKRHDILQLLNSTPKDKAGTNVNITFDPSTYAAKLMKKAQDLKEAGMINADFEVVDDDNE